MFNLTKKILKEAEPGYPIFNGTTTDNYLGLNITNSGMLLRFVIVKGTSPNLDWCVYCHYAENPLSFIITNGDKVQDRRNIENVVSCTDEVWQLYRH